jgi:eukaryotic-like serine/threonine-protein kinase
VKDAPTPDSLGPGSRVGAWRVEGYGGRGTYGVVFRARREGDPGSSPVALKVAQFASDVRFVREVELLSRLRHPSIPRLVDRGWWRAGTGALHPFLAMEWVDGLPLYEWAQVNRATQRQVLEVVAQVAGALEVMHRSGCLHRDVKGDNILVGAEGRAWLMDYGSGTWAGAPPITESVLPPGTHEYRSPEALRFQWAHFRDKEARYEARPTDDLYALGVTAYQLVTRVYPPPGTDPQVLKDSLQAPSPARLPPQELNAQLVPELSVLIERMLAKEPEARGQAREVTEAAESAAARMGTKMDAPLLVWERPTASAVTVPALGAPRVGSERPVSEPVTGAAQKEPLAEAEDVPGETECVSVHARTEYRGSSWGWRPGVVAVAAILLLVGWAWSMALWLRAESPEIAQGEARGAGGAPDAGVTGLGEGMRTVREAPQSEPMTPEAIALEMPEEPLPHQRRAPCRRRGEVEIQGGCWGLAREEPPCGEVSYEWQRACYFPVLDQTRKPTSGQQR